MNPITRFNQTSNGNLHFGHLYTLLVNERFAHDNGGKFIVRIDDTSPPAMNVPEDRRKKLIHSQIADINWLGIEIDAWEWQSELMTGVKMHLDHLGHVPLSEAGDAELPLFTRMNGTNWLPFPYMPQQTAERVIMDNWSGITHLIRGEEFSTEYSLYRYYCQKFDMIPPHFVLLPRLMGKCGDISKTNGGYTITEYRNAGHTADELKELLAKACLYWYKNGWSFHNLKPNPRIDL
jgi:glutamyl/glutaminyl-tRNA synthetase